MFEYMDILFLYHVSIGSHWLTGDGTGRYWLVLGDVGQFGVVLFGT